MDRAKELITPLERELPALYNEPVNQGHVVASSWAEAVLLVAGKYLELLPGWEKFSELDTEGQHRQFRRCFSLMLNVALARASLKIEEARLRERVRAMSPDVRYAYEFQHLKPQSRRLFRYLTQHLGRRVTYEGIAEHVFGDPTAKTGSIQTAVFRLRTELRNFGSTTAADAIKTEHGGYRLE